MDLVTDMAGRLGLDTERVSVALGTLLLAVRVGLDARTWDQLKEVVPDAGKLLGRAPGAGGRTAEIVALTEPGAVRLSLAAGGFPDAAVTELAEALRGAVRGNLAADAAGRVLTALDRALGH